MTTPSSTDEPDPGDLRGFDDSLPIALLRARESVMARFRPHLASHNVTEQQWRVIRALADGGEIDATALSERCCILMPSLSRILKSLEADAILTRHKAASDGRRQLIRLTAKGTQLFSEMAPKSAEIYRQIEGEFGGNAIDTLVDQLRNLQTKLGSSQ